MKKVIASLGAACVVSLGGFGNALADSHEEAEAEAAVPVEIYACRYNEGKGPKDVDAATAKWNAWADDRGLKDYYASTLVPFYFGPEQEFDFLWLGVSPTAKGLGAAQDDWIANGGKIQDEFNKTSTCDGHSNFAAVKFKSPPDRGDDDNFIVSFSDCKMAEGINFGKDIAPALGQWAAYETENGSQAGMWVLFPAYGGGGEEFDFKFVSSHASLEEQGSDWDNYSESGWAKAEELFQGKLRCDSSRVYISTVRRRIDDSEE